MVVPRSRSHAQRETETCRNLRLAAVLGFAVPAGVEGDPPDTAAIGAGLGLLLREWQVVNGAAVEAADECALGNWLLLLHVDTDAWAGPNLRN